MSLTERDRLITKVPSWVIALLSIDLFIGLILLWAYLAKR